MKSTDQKEEQYWTQRYKDGLTGWDIGEISTPLKTYFDQLTNRNINILIPGAGNSYEAQYLHQQGFTQVYVLDISGVPLTAFSERVPSFPKAHLLKENFFEHQQTYDLIIEQTFFCSFEPTPAIRSNYARKMSQLLNKSGKLVGLWFKHPLTTESNRPFGGSIKEYHTYLSPYFETRVFEDCYNSIPPRAGNELFGIFEKRNS